MVLPTIAHRLDLMDPIPSPSAQQIPQEYMRILKAYLHDKQVLLVLDNLEHLLDAAVFIIMKAQVDEQTWQTCWAQGRGLSIEQVINLVLEEGDYTSNSSPAFNWWAVLVWGSSRQS